MAAAGLAQNSLHSCQREAPGSGFWQILLTNFFKGHATTVSVEEGLHPFRDEREPDGSVPHCWADGEWIVFLDSTADIERAIRCVEGNPIKEGLPAQRWNFVQRYDGLV